MLAESRLEVVPGFDAYKLKDMIEARPGWSVELIPVGDVELAPTQKGAALECIDGRFDLLKDRKKHGPRVAGGTNLVAALLTGGSYAGYRTACRLIESSGYTPGTHGDDGCNPETGEKLPGCVAHYLYMTGQLKSAKYPWNMDLVDLARFGMTPVQIVKSMQERAHGGKHFRLNGNHIEEGIRFNPFMNTSERAHSGDRFRADFWYPTTLNHHIGTKEIRKISLADEVAFKCEIIEKAKPSAMKAEIIVP